jgi:hypothetical protein
MSDLTIRTRPTAAAPFAGRIGGEPPRTQENHR